MSESLQPSAAPELVFGLVAPIGVDLDLVTEVLSQTLSEMRYEAREFRLTALMREVPAGRTITDVPYIQSYKDRIAYANAVRSRLGDEALAALAISAIRSFRREETTRRTDDTTIAVENSSVEPDSRVAGREVEEIPLPSQAYIIRQFKRPEEIALLRSVYGRQFILVSAYAPEEMRLRRIEQNERRSCAGLITSVEIHQRAYELVAQDARETLEQHGQNLRDAFPLGDVFIDATSRVACEATLRRFIHLLFGDNEITPTHDEYGMYLVH